MKNSFKSSVLLTLLMACGVTSCLYDSDGGGGDDGLVSENPPGPLRIYRNPYSQVAWQTDQRLLAQHHDHNGASAARLMAYDDAGYDVVPLMDYSGAPEQPGALKARLWPAENCVAASTLAKFKNIQLLIPDAEESGIGQRHYTSPFLTDYIQYSDGAPADDPSPKYSSEAELVSLIQSHGGLPIKAHPWYPTAELISGPDAFGMEIYSAYIAAKRFEGVPEFISEDRNEKLLAGWDAALASGRWWVGLAVNDHYGPYSSPASTDPAIRDSGKILVLARDATLPEYRNAFERGAFFAIRDNGVTKGDYPTINSIVVGADTIAVDASGATEVRWISSGRVIGSGPTLQFTAFPARAVYIRAEVFGQAQVVYTQPFVLRHVDDIDGDGRLTKTDTTLCAEVASGLVEGTPEIDAACAVGTP